MRLEHGGGPAGSEAHVFGMVVDRIRRIRSCPDVAALALQYKKRESSTSPKIAATALTFNRIMKIQRNILRI